MSVADLARSHPLPARAGGLPRSLLLALAITLAVRLALAAWLPLSGDEAYYWVWGHHLRLSYFDHPPFVALLYWLGQPFEAWGGAVRWPGVVLGQGIYALWLLMLRPHLSPERLTWLFWLLALSPLAGFGTLIIVPDVPLLFFWSLALFALIRAVETRHFGWYLLLGFAVGCGALSKYHMIVFVPAGLIWLTLYRKWGALRWSYLIPAVLLSLAIASPVLIWNLQNDWGSFGYQLGEVIAEPPWEPKWTLDYVAAVFFVAFPTIFIAALRRPEAELGWLWVFGWTPILFFLLASIRQEIEMNWPSMALPALIALAVVQTRDVRWFVLPLVVWAVILAAALSDIAHPWLPNRSKLAEFGRYRALAAAVQEYQPLYSHHYHIASQLGFELGRQVYKLPGWGRRDVFDFLPEALPAAPRYFVVVESGSGIPADVLPDGDRVVARHPATPGYEVLEVRRE